MPREIKVFRYKAFGLTTYPHKVHSGLGQHQGTLHDSVGMCMWGALPEDSGQASAPTQLTTPAQGIQHLRLHGH